MGNLVNISGGGVHAPDTFSTPPPAITGLSFGTQISADIDTMTNITFSADVSYFVPIYVPDTRNVDAFVIVAGTGSLTNDLELALYNIDSTGFKLGTNIVGATQTATFTTSTYTEITFTSTEVTEGWHYIGISGISSVAPPNLSGFPTATGTVGKTYPTLGFGIDDTGGAVLTKIGTFQAAVELASAAAGTALTTGVDTTAMPMLRLRNA